MITFYLIFNRSTVDVETFERICSQGNFGGILVGVSWSILNTEMTLENLFSDQLDIAIDIVPDEPKA